MGNWKVDLRRLSKRLPKLSTAEQLARFHAAGQQHGLNTPRHWVLFELRSYLTGHARHCHRAKCPDCDVFRTSPWLYALAVEKSSLRQLGYGLARKHYPGEIEADLRLAFENVCVAFLAECVQDAVSLPTDLEKKLSTGSGLCRDELVAALRSQQESAKSAKPALQQQLRRAARDFLEPDRHRPERLARFIVQSVRVIREHSARLKAEARHKFVAHFLRVGSLRGRKDSIADAVTTDDPMPRQLDTILLAICRLPEMRADLLRLEDKRERRRLRAALTSLFQQVRNHLHPSIEATTEAIRELGAPHLRALRHRTPRNQKPLAAEREAVARRVLAFRKARGHSQLGRGAGFDAIFREVRRQQRSWDKGD